MSYRSKRRQMKAEINVVPYIDVMLVLLIIFMVTSPFITQGVDVNLPQTADAKSGTELAEDKDSSTFVTIQLDKEGILGLRLDNDQMITGLSMIELTDAVKKHLEQHPNAPVLVGGDQAVPYGEIIQMMDQLKTAGVKSVGLLTQPIDN